MQGDYTSKETADCESQLLRGLISSNPCLPHLVVTQALSRWMWAASGSSRQNLLNAGEITKDD